MLKDKKEEDNNYKNNMLKDKKKKNKTKKQNFIISIKNKMQWTCFKNEFGWSFKNTT